jgi:hypothetical protein
MAASGLSAMPIFAISGDGSWTVIDQFQTGSGLVLLWTMEPT